MDIDEVAFRAELQASVDSGDVPQSWSSWVGSARVSVAVPLNKEVDQGRMYCFLPMGNEATAPFHGFLDANFYTPIDRRRIHANCRLNKFFVERAAWLCWQTIEHLRHLEESWVPRVTADLLCWSEAEGAGLLMKECKSTVSAIGAAPVAPVLATDRRFAWAAINKVVIWHHERHGCLKSDLLSVAASVKILLPGLGIASELSASSAFWVLLVLRPHHQLLRLRVGLSLLQSTCFNRTIHRRFGRASTVMWPGSSRTSTRSS